MYITYRFTILVDYNCFYVCLNRLPIELDSLFLVSLHLVAYQAVGTGQSWAEGEPFAKKEPRALELLR